MLRCAALLALLASCGDPAPPSTCQAVCTNDDLACLQSGRRDCAICYYDTCCYWDGKRWNEIYTDCQLALPDAATASAAAADIPRSPPAR